MARRMTICEMHRQIIRLLKDNGKDNKQALELLARAYTMGKLMSKELTKYKKRWDAGWWQVKRGWEIDNDIEGKLK